MRRLAFGEVPEVGSKVRIIHDGRVTKMEKNAQGKTRIYVQPDYRGDEVIPWTFFVEGAVDRAAPEFHVTEEAPRKWVTGAMYCSPGADPTGNAYYLRRRDGWKAVSNEEIFHDGSVYLTEGFLRKLKIMEIKK